MKTKRKAEELACMIEDEMIGLLDEFGKAIRNTYEVGHRIDTNTEVVYVYCKQKENWFLLSMIDLMRDKFRASLDEGDIQLESVDYDKKEGTISYTLEIWYVEEKEEPTTTKWEDIEFERRRGS